MWRKDKGEFFCLYPHGHGKKEGRYKMCRVLFGESWTYKLMLCIMTLILDVA